MGGIHASLIPDEVVKFADSVVVGEVETVWEKVLKDFANKKLKKFPMNEFIPCAHLFPILEPLWEGIGLGLLIKLIRKKKDKIKRFQSEVKEKKEERNLFVKNYCIPGSSVRSANFHRF